MIKDSLLSIPFIYWLWQKPFERQKFVKGVPSHLPQHQSVIDIGCGPGTSFKYFNNVSYFGIDFEQKYIDHATKKYGPYFMQLNALEIDKIYPRTFDLIFINSLLHHLDDENTKDVLKKSKSLFHDTSKLVLLELVIPNKLNIFAYILCKLDRGKFARTTHQWKTLVQESFKIEACTNYYITCFGIPLWKMISIQAIKS